MASTQKINNHWGFPATATNVSNFVDSVREQQNEKVYRQKPAKGLPHDASVCRMHRDILNQQSQAGRDVTPRGLPELSLVDDPVFMPEQMVVPVGPPILPHCTLCFYAGNHLLPNSPIPEGFDACLCATRLLTSHCIYCALGDLHQSISSAITQRTRLDVDSHEFLTCECGSHIMMIGDVGELIRKCVGCGGTVTAPFRNWVGDEIVFLKKSNVPALTLTGSEGRVPELDSLVDIQPREAEVEEVVIVDGDEVHWKYAGVRREASTIASEKVEKAGSPPAFNSHQDALPACDNEDTPPVIVTQEHEPKRRPSRKANATNNTRTQRPLCEITNLSNRIQPSRRSELNELGDRAGIMSLQMISRAMKSFGFSIAEAEDMIAFVTGQGLQEIEGKDLVAGMEKALRRRIQ